MPYKNTPSPEAQARRRANNLATYHRNKHKLDREAIRAYLTNYRAENREVLNAKRRKPGRHFVNPPVRTPGYEWAQAELKRLKRKFDYRPQPSKPYQRLPPLPLTALPGEEWRPIVHYETHYAVSNLGNVRRMAQGNRTRVGRPLKWDFDEHGYPRVTLCVNNRPQRFQVHRLVARAFIGRAPTKSHIVNHKDGDKANPTRTNLEWATQRENVQHAIRTGLRRTRVTEHQPDS